MIAKRLLKAFILDILVLFALVIVLYTIIAIPKNERWWKNFQQSYVELENEGAYPIIIKRGEQHWDNWTASNFMSFLYYFDNKHPFQSGITLKFSESTKELDDDIIYHYIGALVNGDEIREREYSRYWGGHNIILYPFLYFSTINSLRLVMFLTELALIIWIFYLNTKNGSISVGIAFAISIIMAHWILNSMCIVYGIDIILSSVAILLWYKLKNQMIPEMYAFLLGGLTMFFCFLSTPMIVLGMWLVMVAYEDKNKTWIRRLYSIIRLSMAWAVGFAFMMEVKGILAKAIGLEATANSRMDTLIGNAGLIERIKTSIWLAGWFVWPWKVLILLILGFALWMFITKKYSMNAIMERIPILFIALYPFVWEFIFYTHTGHGIEKNLFVISAFAGLIVLLQPLDSLKIKGKEV